MTEKYKRKQEEGKNVSSQQYKEDVDILPPIPATSEDYERYLQRRDQKLKQGGCTKGEGGFLGCVGECPGYFDDDHHWITEACVPMSFKDPKTHELILWCECLPTDDVINWLRKFGLTDEETMKRWPKIFKKDIPPKEET